MMQQIQQIPSLQEASLNARSLFSNCPFIVTLERGTCSARATELLVQHAFDQKENPPIIHVESFELALREVQKSINALIFVPDIHELGRELVMRRDFDFVQSASFVLDNPPIYLARSSSSLIVKERVGTYASLETIAGLAGFGLGRKLCQLVKAKSTQEAARMVHAGEVEFAITNEAGVASYSLNIVKELKHMKIIWKCFRFNGGVE